MRQFPKLFQEPGPVSTTQNFPAAKTAVHALARSVLGSGDELPQISTRNASSSNSAAVFACSPIMVSMARSITRSCTAGMRISTLQIATIASSRPGSQMSSRCMSVSPW
jgi:hypothetical protein